MIHVTHVEPAGDYRLALRFDDGSAGVADLRSEIERRKAFAPLRDAKRFAKAFVQDGTVCWPGDLDLAAERLHALANALPIPETRAQAEKNQLEVSLRELRKFAGKTQAEVSDALGIAQSELSRFERRDDIKLGSLRRYVEALDGELELVVTIGNRRMVVRA